MGNLLPTRSNSMGNKLLILRLHKGRLMQEFDFSENGLKKRQRFVWIVVLVSMPCVFLMILLTSDIKTSILVTAFAVVAVLTLSLATVQMRFINKSMRAMKVIVDGAGIVKRHAGGEENLAWDDIVGVDVRENSRGGCVHIKMRSKDKNSIHLSGFERMHEIAELIRQNVSEHVTVETKRSKTDPGSLAYCILGGVVILTAIAFGLARGANLHDTFKFAFSGGIALYFLAYRPMTKFNAEWKRYEILCGFAMMLIAIRMLIRMFTVG